MKRKGNEMTKNETRELQMAQTYIDNNMTDTAARSVSSLIRSAKSMKSKYELVHFAKKHNLLAHPEFKCGFQIIN
jgi:hypothetical protein